MAPSSATQPPETQRYLLPRAQLDALLQALRQLGFTLVGPTLRQQAVVYDVIESAAELPVGYTDVQEAGTYRLERRDDAAVFGYVNAPNSWKTFLHPPKLTLARVRREAGNLRFEQPSETPPKYAFIGVRSCELHAIATQDRVLLGDRWVDEHYRARREANFIVAVNCGQASNTCFCVSMQTGPRASFGFDLSLTELLEPSGHRFVVEVGSQRGQSVVETLGLAPAVERDAAQADAVVEKTATQMGRELDTSDIRALLYDNFDHPRWDAVAERCLACANCTMVCPTCFCTTVEEVSDLAGTTAERVRSWDSCFTKAFSFVHSGPVRETRRARYRQWMTHKLATWIDQFGTSGCVGCGRCITWCPVGIDITEETAAIRSSAKPGPKEDDSA